MGNRRFLSCKTLAGNKVRNSRNEDLGKVEDFMLDLNEGKIAYAVLSFGGFIGIGEKLFAVPWSALRLDQDKRDFVLDVEKEALKSAPGFEKDKWPDFADLTFGRQIHEHYKTTPYWDAPALKRCAALARLALRCSVSAEIRRGPSPERGGWFAATLWKLKRRFRHRERRPRDCLEPELGFRTCDLTIGARRLLLKVLLATDGSPHATAALNAVLGRAWPLGTALRILSVSHPIPLIPDPLLFGAAMHHESVERVAKQADQIVAAAAEEARARAPALRVSTVTREGSPRKLIVLEAKRWKADLVVVGAEGHGALRQFLLGSVAHTVAFHAPCSVEIVRAPRSALRSNV